MLKESAAFANVDFSIGFCWLKFHSSDGRQLSKCFQFKILSFLKEKNNPLRYKYLKKKKKKQTKQTKKTPPKKETPLTNILFAKGIGGAEASQIFPRYSKNSIRSLAPGVQSYPTLPCQFQRQLFETSGEEQLSTATCSATRRQYIWHFSIATTSSTVCSKKSASEW